MLSPEALAASVTAVALSLAEGRSEEELAIISAVLEQLRHTLETIALARLRIENLQHGTNRNPIADSLSPIAAALDEEQSASGAQPLQTGGNNP